MNGHYEEREIKIVEVTFYNGFKQSTYYELRAYNDDGTYTVLCSSDDMSDLSIHYLRRQYAKQE